MVERVARVTGADTALESLQDGDTLLIGGSLFHNKPMYLVREIARRGLRDLTVVAVPQASMDVDLLIAANCVAEVRVPYFGFEYLGLAPAFRRYAAEGRVRVWECDETQLLAALDATARNVPSGIVRSGLGTDLPRLNGDLKVVSDHVTGEPVIAVPALKPDFAIVHAAAADRFGNLRYAGYAFADPFIAEATRQAGGTVVASVEEVVADAVIGCDPFRTDIPAIVVDHVVEAPHGAWPCSSHGVYQFDEAGLMAYLEAAATDAGFDEYAARHLVDVTGAAEYVDRFATPSSLARNRRAIHG